MRDFKDVLEKKVEDYSMAMLESVPIFSEARHGRVSEGEVFRYLGNIKYLVHHTPIHLQKASIAADRANLPRLSRFYREKLREETGHEEWADRDLSSLSPASSPASSKDMLPRPEAATVELIRFIEATIHEDPMAYLGYILVSEYSTVVAGPIWLERLNRSCGIPEARLSVVSNHVVLDRQHVGDDLRMISDLAGERPIHQERILAVVDESMRLFTRFCMAVKAPQ